MDNNNKVELLDEEEIDHIEGWVIAEDTETGKQYWANIFTQETSWDEPEAVVEHRMLQSKAKEHTRRATSFGTQTIWIAVLDEETQQTYYYNKMTQETVWEKPEGFVESSQDNNNHEQKKDEVNYSQIKMTNSHGFLDKQLTVIEEKVKEVSKLESYSDIFRQATEFNIDNTNYSVDIKYDFSKIEKDILAKIQQTNLMDFVAEYFPQRTSWGKPIPINQIFIFSKKLSKPLTNLNKQIESASYQTFKNILSYTGERKSSKAEIKHAQKLILIGMSAPGEIKDEIFFQLCKQIIENPNNDKALRVWQLFGILASCFSPSTDTILYPILNFLYQYAHDKNAEENVKEYAKFVFGRLVRGFMDEKRKQPPSNEEILYVEKKKQIMLPIYFMTGANTFVPVESYSTAGEVKEEIFKKLDLNMQRLPYYCLYEVNNRTNSIEERVIENNERILDLFSQWEMEVKTNKNKNDKHEFRMYLRIRVFFELNEQDVDSLTMFYLQAVYEMIHGRYLINNEDIIKLAAIQLQHDYGDYKGNPDKILKNLKQYIPITHYDLMSPKEWFDQIVEHYSRLQELNKKTCKLEYIDYVKQQNGSLYLSQQYYVKYRIKSKDTIPDLDDNREIILAIKPTGIVLCYPETRVQICEEFTFKQSIVTWGVSSEIFVLVVGSSNENQKFYFESYQGQAIDFLMTAYSNIQLGKSINTLEAKTLSHGAKKGGEGNQKKAPNRGATVFQNVSITNQKKK